MSDVTGITGSLAGISGRHLLQSPPPPVTTQLTSAATNGANTVVNGVERVLQTLELVPQPVSRHLLHATPSPLTDAALVNTVGASPVLSTSATNVSTHADTATLAVLRMSVNCGRTVPLKTMCSLPIAMRATNCEPFQHVLQEATTG